MWINVAATVGNMKAFVSMGLITCWQWNVHNITILCISSIDFKVLLKVWETVFLFYRWDESERVRTISSNFRHLTWKIRPLMLGTHIWKCWSMWFVKDISDSQVSWLPAMCLLYEITVAPQVTHLSRTGDPAGYYRYLLFTSALRGWIDVLCISKKPGCPL